MLVGPASCVDRGTGSSDSSQYMFSGGASLVSIDAHPPDIAARANTEADRMRDRISGRHLNGRSLWPVDELRWVFASIRQKLVELPQSPLSIRYESGEFT